MAGYKKDYKNQPKKKKDHKPVCSECLTSSEQRYYGSVDSLFVNPEPVVYIKHSVCVCDICSVKLKVPKDEFKIYDERKKKKVEMLNWVEGEPTTKGNKRYIFLKEDGTETTLLPQTGLKKGLKPKLKTSKK